MKWLRDFGRLLGKHGEATDAVVGMNRRNIEFVYQYNRRRDYPLVDDKVTCKTLLQEAGVPVADTLAVCDGLYDVERALEVLSNEQDFAVKPANSSGGNGIVVLGRRVEHAHTVGWERHDGGVYTVEELRTHLANIVFGAFGYHLSDRALVERKLEPHPVLREFWPSGVCDLRVIVCQGEPMLAMLRVPTRRSAGKANLHQGGVGVAVDVSTGRTRRASIRGVAIEHHPETGKPLTGVQLPGWEEVMQVALRSASTVPLGYLGVDVVLDAERGPMVLELNARPGLEIQNVNGISLAEARTRVPA